MVLRRGRIGEVYNIGGFNEEQNIAIVRKIISIVARIMAEEPAYRKLLKNKDTAIDESLISYVSDRPGHDIRYARWDPDNRAWVDSVISGEYMNYYQQMYIDRK